MTSDAPPSPRSPRPRIVLWIALVIAVLGGVLLYDLVRSAKKSKELMKKPPAARTTRFLGQGDDDDDRPPRPRPTGSASASASASAPPPAASP